MDELSLPMVFCLLDEIGELPPSDFFDNAQAKAQREAMNREKKTALGSFSTVKGKVRRRKDGD